MPTNNIGMIGEWTMPYETFEEKYEKMKMDKFKKDYPIFSNIQHILNFGKTGYKIYNSEYLKETDYQSLF